MPLLNGHFDPARLNAVTLGRTIFYEGPHVCEWEDLRADLRQDYIDHAQRVLDRLVAEGVLTTQPPVALFYPTEDEADCDFCFGDDRPSAS